MRIVVAGFGNVLRSDDGFGIAVLEHLETAAVPSEVSLLDVGIGGIHLVQTLLGDPADVLVILDAVEVDRPPGTVVVVVPDVLDVTALPLFARHEHLADVHYATPDRALMLLRALEVLPEHTITIGCQPLDVDTPVHGLSPAVLAAVPTAVAEVRRTVTELGVPWPGP